MWPSRLKFSDPSLHEPDPHLCIGLFGRTNLLRPGPSPLQRSRIFTTNPSCQLTRHFLSRAGSPPAEKAGTLSVGVITCPAIEDREKCVYSGSKLSWPEEAARVTDIAYQVTDTSCQKQARKPRKSRRRRRQSASFAPCLRPRWSTNISSKVNLPHTINLSANLVISTVPDGSYLTQFIN